MSFSCCCFFLSSQIIQRQHNNLKYPESPYIFHLCMVMAILPVAISEWDYLLRAVSSNFIILSRPGIKKCTTVIKGMHHAVFMIRSVTTGVKVVYYHNLVCKADQWDCFSLRSVSSLYLLKYNWNASTIGWDLKILAEDINVKKKYFRIGDM